MASFLSPRTRELIPSAGASYADATGNLHVVTTDPAVFVESQGAERDPDRKPRPLRSLKGAAAARVVRALCDFEPPFGVRALADWSATPLGTVSRVVSLLGAHPIAGEVTMQARGFLEELFGARASFGAQMAVRASVGLQDEAAIALSCEVLARRLLDAWKP